MRAKTQQAAPVRGCGLCERGEFPTAVPWHGTSRQIPDSCSAFGRTEGGRPRRRRGRWRVAALTRLIHRDSTDGCGVATAASAAAVSSFTSCSVMRTVGRVSTVRAAGVGLRTGAWTDNMAIPLIWPAARFGLMPETYDRRRAQGGVEAYSNPGLECERLSQAQALLCPRPDSACRRFGAGGHTRFRLADPHGRQWGMDFYSAYRPRVRPGRRLHAPHGAGRPRGQRRVGAARSRGSATTTASPWRCSRS